MQTLIGDAIDNVPGIPGVGEKTAAKLIKKYGTADAVLQHLDELTPKMRENFEKYGDRIPIARQLVTLKDDVEFEFDARDVQVHRAERPTACSRTCTQLGFHEPAQAARRRRRRSTRAPLGLPPVARRRTSRSTRACSAGDGAAGRAKPRPTRAEPGIATGADCKYELRPDRRAVRRVPRRAEAAEAVRVRHRDRLARRRSAPTSSA